MSAAALSRKRLLNERLIGRERKPTRPPITLCDGRMPWLDDSGLLSAHSSRYYEQRQAGPLLMITGFGSVEYNVMATKMAPCAAAIFRTHHDIPRGHAERTARAGRKILVFPGDRTRRFSS
jgi:hypothetical protein